MHAIYLLSLTLLVKKKLYKKFSSLSRNPVGNIYLEYLVSRLQPSVTLSWIGLNAPNKYTSYTYTEQNT